MSTVNDWSWSALSGSNDYLSLVWLGCKWSAVNDWLLLAVWRLAMPTNWAMIGSSYKLWQLAIGLQWLAMTCWHHWLLYYPLAMTYLLAMTTYYYWLATTTGLWSSMYDLAYDLWMVQRMKLLSFLPPSPGRNIDCSVRSVQLLSSFHSSEVLFEGFLC